MSSRKKIKVLLQARRRLRKRNAELKTIITDLRKQALISSNSVDILESCAGGIPDLLKRQKAKLQNQTLPTTYSPELRSFALTLHFYSPRAYNYVRKVFDTCLPHPRTISRWYQSVDDAPGFTKYAFNALKMRSEGLDRKLLCSLIMDEVAIHRKIDFDGVKFHGQIDMGTELDDDALPVAKEALVFMVVDLKSSWKLPVGYFLINGLGGEERKALVTDCIERLYAAGVIVVSLTHDGAAANLSMLQSLGITWSDTGNVKSFFRHPLHDSNVYIFLDPCHMLKLVRNTLAAKGSIFSNDSIVRWEYFVSLHKLQQAEGLHLGNKLRASHIEWFKKKMNVKVAAQTLSDSVATSLEFCAKENFSEFKGCEETITFIRMFDKLFDILNSRNLKSFGFKAPLQLDNYINIFNYLSTAQSYILTLQESKSRALIINSNRKTGFLGFLLCIQSVKLLFEEFILSDRYGLKFLLSYKFSQDHIELFFGKIRSMSGCNDNPTARQFKSAYKKILTHNDIQNVVSGNCLALEDIPILTAGKGYVVSNNVEVVVPSVVSINSSLSKKRMMDDSFLSQQDDEDIYIPSEKILSCCSEKIVAYIGGFVCFKLKKSLHCETCANALIDLTSSSPIHSLIALKSKSCLTTPSADVIDICKTSEKFFRQYVASSGSEGMSNTACHKLVQSVMKYYIDKNIFSSINDHMLQNEGYNNHLVLLLKSVVQKYLQVRYYYASKQYTAKLKERIKSKSRQVLNRLVIFSGQ